MFEIRELQEQDIEPITSAFAALGWNKPASQYQSYLSQQTDGSMVVLVAFADGEFVGYVTILWVASYPPFRDAAIPEISDFNVLPKARRKRYGSRLLDLAEDIVAQKTDVVGLGVGLDADYGAAQRLYVLRGYVPDGRGLCWRHNFLKYGDTVIVDDDLNLYFTKKLR
jgi:GNAT superfamily N-acetyltransferase